MPKCIRLYSDTYQGLCSELALSETGNWFYRFEYLSTYGKAISKWTNYGKLLKVNRKLLKWEDKGQREMKKQTLEFIFNKNKVISITYDSRWNSKVLNKYRLPE